MSQGIRVRQVNVYVSGILALLTDDRRDALRRAYWAALVPGAALFMLMQVVVHARGNMIGADSHAYWMAVQNPKNWYSLPPAHRDAFLYAPAFAHVIWPIGQLSWPAFQTVWIGAQIGVLGWLLAPLGWRKGLTVAPLLVTEFLLGNVYFFLAGALALSMRRAPGVLAVPVLTKIAPAVVGVWFIVRGEWRSVLGAVAGTLVIVAPSVALAPQAWASWLAFLSSSARDGGIGASLRLLGALVLVVYAGRCSRAWLLAPATILACPVLGGYSPLAVCAAIPRLLEFSRDRRDEAASAELDDPFPLEPTER